MSYATSLLKLNWKVQLYEVCIIILFLTFTFCCIYIICDGTCSASSIKTFLDCVDASEFQSGVCAGSNTTFTPPSTPGKNRRSDGMICMPCDVSAVVMVIMHSFFLAIWPWT